MDDDRLVFPNDGNFTRGALGLCGSRLGWLLGMGPGRKRVFAAVADGHRVSAFRDDAGKARDDEGLERLAGFLHFHVVDPGNLADAQWRGQFGARLRAIEHWQLVRGFSGADSCSVLYGLREESRLFEERESARLHGLSRIQLFVQQSNPAGFLYRGALRNALPGFLGMVFRVADQRRSAVLQQSEHSDRPAPAVPDRRGPAIGLAQ